MWSGSEYGSEARPHGMNINAGESRMGAEYIPCGTCHRHENADVPHGPPGARPPPDHPDEPWWLLPPVSMQWFGKSSAEICEQIKDRKRNGERSIAEIAGHVAKDPKVAWGWTPGPGRAPAPYSAGQLVDFINKWDKAGAPCPSR
jgi:hypothetical protein